MRGNRLYLCHSRFLPATLLLLTLCLFWPGVSEASPDTVSVLQTDELPAGEQVKSSGEKLISQPFGFTRISSESSRNVRIGHIAVHGFGSEGYEWVGPLVQLADIYTHTFIYRYDWNVCPEEVAEKLAVALIELLDESVGVEKLVLFGHSYGGLVVTFCASKLHLNIPVETHTIAAPLGGYGRLFEKCSVTQDRDGRAVYPIWESNATHIQWRTQYKLDNAFRRLREDPQETNLTNSTIFLLPATMDGHRLGHNWSITWVIDEYLGIPHSP